MLLHHHYVLSYQRARPILASTSGADQSDNHRTFLPIQRLETPTYKALLGSNFFFPTADSLFFWQSGAHGWFSARSFLFSSFLHPLPVWIRHWAGTFVEPLSKASLFNGKLPWFFEITAKKSRWNRINTFIHIVAPNDFENCKPRWIATSMDHWDQDWSPASLMGRELETQEFLEGFIPARDPGMIPSTTYWGYFMLMGWLVYIDDWHCWSSLLLCCQDGLVKSSNTPWKIVHPYASLPVNFDN